MSADKASSGSLAQWVGSWAGIIAPISVLSALLFYFGYVSSRAQYEYFGIDVDTIGLGTQEYIMRSPQPLLVPLLGLTLLGVTGLTLDAAVRRRVSLAVNASATHIIRRIRLMIGMAKVVGLVVLSAGVLLLLTFAYFQSWAAYSLATPLLIATGAGLAGYASLASRRMHDHLPKPAPAEVSEDLNPARDSSLGGSATLRQAATVMSYVLIAASIFWATATLAEWAGRGRAQAQAGQLDRLPRVILDTKERLFLRSPGLEESSLPPTEGQTFRYRYRNLRLLIVGRDRMFLVPEHWSASNTTLVVPIDDSVRIQFQFQNQRP